MINKLKMSNNLYDKDGSMPNGDVNKRKCRNIGVRATYFSYLLVLGFGWVIFSIINLQFFDEGKERREKATKYNYRLANVPAKRGDILSANGNVISLSIDKYKLFMDLRSSQLPDKKFNSLYGALADSLSNFFGDKSASSYRSNLKKWRAQGHASKLISPSGRYVDWNDLEKIRKFPILNSHPNNGGVISEHKYHRLNYYGSLAQRTIGRAETGNRRGYGVELSFDKELSGVNGKRNERKISGSFWIPIESRDDKKPIDGADIKTTIDVNIQNVADNSLREMITNNSAISGTAIVMRVKSGKISAMVNLGRNKKGEIIEDYNHAIADNLEPGSTFKLLPLMILLDNKDMTMSSIIDTKKGVDVVAGKRVSDTQRGGLGKISLKTAMSKSSNIAFAKAIDTYYAANPQEYIDKIHATGITKKFDFQLQGEAAPYIKKHSKKIEHWAPSDLVVMSYGYAVEFTALRTLMLYNAIANGGKLITPIVVSEVCKDGKTIKEFKSEVLNEAICKSSTLSDVRMALEDISIDGGVKRLFKDEKYLIAGKSGTSWQLGPDGKYDSEEGIYYLSSFVGYFPADNPEYSCIVQIKTLKPRGIARAYYGNVLAAPVFKDISSYLNSFSNWDNSSASLRELEIEKSRNTGESTYEEIPFEKKTIRTICNRDEIEYIKEHFDLGEYSFKYIDDDIQSYSTMPNVVGLGMKEAISRLENAGLMVKAKGRGRVVRQSIKKGNKISKNQKVSIELNI